MKKVTWKAFSDDFSDCSYYIELVSKVCLIV